MASRGTILVVDDDEGVLGFIQMALEDEGYEVITAEHGAAALDILRQQPVQLILLDLRMPVMDGWQFARAYRQMPLHHAPIVVVSAGRDGHEQAAEIAAEAYLARPLDLNHLLEVVARYTT